MRSETTDPLVMNTTALISPQVSQIVNSGDKITGPGFSTTIFTKCACTAGTSVQNLLTIAPQLTNVTAAKLLANYNALSVVGLANRIDFDGSTVTVTSLLANIAICGGIKPSFISVCTTTFTDHFFATVSQVYTSDGSGSTVTQNAALLVKLGSRADISWIYASMKNILEGVESSIPLAPTVPGLMNPLLWWTTSGNHQQ